MSARPITVRKLKEILRLKYQAQLAHRQIALSLHISSSTVSYYLNRAAQLDITTWPLCERWDDVTLERAFLSTRAVSKTRHKPLPDWAVLHQELKQPGQKGVTLELLWQEYAERNNGAHYSYNHFCRLYKEWASVLQPSMRQTHIAGEKLFVDYCGQTMPIVDPHTGEILYRAQVFVAVLGASNYTFAEATRSQQLEDWVMSHKRAFEFFGGVPQLVVPDCLKSAVSVARNTDPDLNPTYQMLAAHFGTAIMPARPRKPKDKSKAEVGVQIVTRWILAVLRHETFHSLAHLNQRISGLLTRSMRNPSRSCPVAAHPCLPSSMRQHSSPCQRTPTSTPKWCRCWSARITTSTWRSTITRSLMPCRASGWKPIWRSVRSPCITRVRSSLSTHAVIAKASTAVCPPICQRITRHCWSAHLNAY
ncbi:hypothetical protein WP9W18E04_17970 [Aeromonas veronii]|nr:hypothetical protein WP9W18E04_17970 [Aeromonas veronii]